LLVGVGGAVWGGWEIGYPFRGPGFDRQRGVVALEPERMLVVAITQGDIASGGGRGFSEALRGVLDGMDTHDGLVGYSVRRQVFGSRVWTMSVWTDYGSLGRFVASPAHRSAVRNGGVPREAVISAYREVPAGKLPLSWSEAKSILAEAAEQEAAK
jgi:heme-degrading monooxygenase HmoA